MTRISAVLPSFNHAEYLKKAVESIFNQTHPPDEVIVVDDGSTDDSVDILRAFGDRIRLEVQPNRGTYPALNRAISLSTGDWIAIQNSDDLWRPEKLAKQLALVQQNPTVGVVYTDFQIIDAESNVVCPKPPGVPDRHAPMVEELLPTIIHDMPVIISSAMISREAWEKFGPFDPRFLGAGDWDLCLRMSQGFPFGFVDEPLTLHRKHAANATTDSSRIPHTWAAHDTALMREKTIPLAIQTLFEKGLRRQIPRESAAFGLACIGVVYARDRMSARARDALLKSVRLNPMRLKTWYRLATTLVPS